MVLNDIFGYLKSRKDDGLIIERSIDSILEEIRLYNNNNGQKPKILINLRTFIDYYFNKFPSNFIYGTRFQLIKKDFEDILEMMKSAGAELFFASKSAPNRQESQLVIESFDRRSKIGLDFLSSGSTAYVPKYSYKVHSFAPRILNSWLIVFAQSAQKFGEFRENECLTRVSTAGHVKTANEEDFYLIIGNEPAYLFREGSWKFFCYEVNNYKLLFEEYDKHKILKHFNCNTLEQFQLVAVFSGRFFDNPHTKKTLNKYFSRKDLGVPDYQKITDFIQKFAPLEKFPLKSDTIDAMLTEIFKDVTDDLREAFNSSYRHDHYLYNNGDSRFKDEEINSVLRNNPFAFLAEGILNKIVRSFHSAFLDSTATDMKTLEELTIGWMQRFGGILLNFVEEPKKFTIGFQMRETNKVEFIEVIPVYPPFFIPELKNLITGKMTLDTKYKILAFLIGNSISIDDLKTIPLEYMMHVIITTHLVKNNSMTINEATAMTKTLASKKSCGYIIYPKETNVRAFRVSILYEELFTILLMCLSPIGMEKFMTEMKYDGVLFQNIINDMNDEHQNDTCDAFQHIMKIIKDQS